MKHITGVVIYGVRLLKVIRFTILNQETLHIECQYCFGAKELTRDGRLFSPCPVCQGGKLNNKELEVANKKWLQELNDDLENFNTD